MLLFRLCVSTRGAPFRFVVMCVDWWFGVIVFRVSDYEVGFMPRCPAGCAAFGVSSYVCSVVLICAFALTCVALSCWM